MRLSPFIQPLIEQMKLWDSHKGNYIPFKLWPKQVDFLTLLHNNLRIISLKKRQVGLSQLTGADSLAQCLVQDNFRVLILSKTGEDAEEYLRRVSDMYASLPECVRKANPTVKDMSDRMEFFSGSRLISLPANKGEGFTADRVVIDEAGRISKRDSKIELDTVLKHVEPTLDKTGGQLVMISVASGFNLFKTYWDRAIQDKSSFKAFFFGCYDDPTFTEEKRNQIIRDHGGDHAAEHYPRNPEEAFLSTGRKRFNIFVLNKVRSSLAIKDGERGSLRMAESGKVNWEPDGYGFWELWQKPEWNDGFLIGGDTSEGIERPGLMDSEQKTDFSTLEVFHQGTLEQYAELHVRVPPDVYALEVEKAFHFFNEPYVTIERNKDGFGVLLYLENRVHNLHRHESIDRETQTIRKKLGMVTDRLTKPMMVSNLDQFIREERLTIHSKRLISELLAYVVHPNGDTGAEAGAHDDLVMALMLLLWGQKYAPPYEPAFEHPDYRKEYWDEVIQKEESNRVAKVI